MDPLKTVAAIVLLLFPLTECQVRPPNFSPDALPDTDFSCEDKVTGGYYADIEADCQLFHVCVQVSEYEFQDFHFLCPNDTVFDQQHLVCTNWFEVDCHAQIALVPLQFFTNDFGIKSSGDDDYDYTPEPEENTNNLGFLGRNPPLNSRLRNGGRGQIESIRSHPGISRFPEYYDYDEDEDARGGGPRHDDTPSRHNLVHPPITTTPIPLGFTTATKLNKRTRVAADLSNNRNRGHVRVAEEDQPPTFVEEDDEEVITLDPFNHPPKSRLGGRRPRVKSDIKAKFANSGKKFRKKKFKKKASKKVKLDGRDRKKIEFVEPIEDELIQEPFTGPEVIPDGRSPRVKADLFQNKGVVETTTFEPFHEQFFASPSTISPVIFTGSPAPDLFGSASTSQPFFIPTPKSLSAISPLSQAPLTFSISDTSFSRPDPPARDILPPTATTREQGRHTDLSDEKRRSQTNRFLSRSSSSQFSNIRKGSRGRNRIVVRTTEKPSFSDISDDNKLEKQFTGDLSGDGPQQLIAEQQKPRVKSDLVQTKRKQGKKFSRVRVKFADGERDCSNPFNCPPTHRAPGGRARVKSNVRARSRNFWQPTKRQKINKKSKVVKSFGVGTMRKRRVRKGRKNVRQPHLNSIQNDVDFDDSANINEQEEVSPTHSSFEPTPSQPQHENRFDEQDVFEQDLVVASSTVSPVVFKGSPTPSFGFFSSPRPFFNNIGSHVDIGGKSHGRNSVFISSTLSNKIFIGSAEEETTKPSVPEQVFEPTVSVNLPEKSRTRNFPSFPVISGTSSKPFQTRNKFSRRRKPEPTKSERDSLLKEILSVLDVTVPQTESTTATMTSAPRVTTEAIPTREPITTLVTTDETPENNPRFPIRRGPRVKSNVLFNRRNRPNRRKFGIKKTPITTTTTQPTTTITTTTITTTTTTTTTETTTLTTTSEATQKVQDSNESEPIVEINLPALPVPTSISQFTLPDSQLLVTNPRALPEGLFSQKRGSFLEKNRKFNSFKPNFQTSGLLRKPFLRSNIKVKPFTSFGREPLTPAPSPILETTFNLTESEEKDLFDDVFEADLVFASSTLSPVVFRGSPTPSFGSFSSSRPSFNNIGAHIDLGARKNQGRHSVFIASSTTEKTTETEAVDLGTAITPTDTTVDDREEIRITSDEEETNTGHQVQVQEEPRNRFFGFQTNRGLHRPRVKSNLFRAKARRPPANGNIRVEFKKANIEEKEMVDIDDEKDVFSIRPDGRKPRVKSNIRAKLANAGKVFKLGTPKTFFKHSKKVDLETPPPLSGANFDANEDENKIDSTEGKVEEPNENKVIPGFINPSGRRPRVKSNIRARLANRGKFPFKRSQLTPFVHHLIGKEDELTTGITQQPVTTPLDPNSILLQFVKNKNKSDEEEVPPSSATPSSTESFTIFTTTSTSENKLSAFRALQQQTKSAKIDNLMPEVETGTEIVRDSRNDKQLSRDPKDYDYKYYESDVV